MDKFKQVIKDSYVEQELPQGHEARFLEKLPASHRVTGRSRMLIRSIALVASLAAAVAAVIFIMPGTFDSQKSREAEIAELIDYADYSMSTLQNDVLTLAIEKLPEAEYIVLKDDLAQLIDEYQEYKVGSAALSPNEYSQRIYDIMRRNTQIMDGIYLALNNN